MLRRTPFMICLLAAFCLRAPFMLEAQEKPETIMLVGYHDPPFIIEPNADGQAEGHTVDVLRRIFQVNALPFKISVLPIRRALDSVQSDSQRCAFAYIQNDERRPHYRWVGPVQQGGWGLFTRPLSAANPKTDAPQTGASKSDAPKKLADLRGKSVVVQYGGALENELRQAGIKVITTNDSHIGFKPLFSGRVDYIAGGLTTIPTKARDLDYPEPHLAMVIRRLDYYLACSKAVPGAVTDRLQKTLETLTAAGTLTLE